MINRFLSLLLITVLPFNSIAADIIEEVINGNLYINYKYKFSIQFPEDWEILNCTNPSFIKKALDKDGNSVMVGFRVIPDSIGLDFMSFTDKQFKLFAEDFIKENIASYNLIYKDVIILDKGIRHIAELRSIYMKILYTGHYGDNDFRIISQQYYIPYKNNIFYSLSGASLEKSFKQNESIIKSAVKSFKIEK